VWRAGLFPYGEVEILFFENPLERQAGGGREHWASLQIEIAGAMPTFVVGRRSAEKHHNTPTTSMGMTPLTYCKTPTKAGLNPIPFN
jgi:hypothetical protein